MELLPITVVQICTQKTVYSILEPLTKQQRGGLAASSLQAPNTDINIISPNEKPPPMPNRCGGERRRPPEAQEATRPPEAQETARSAGGRRRTRKAAGCYLFIHPKLKIYALLVRHFRLSKLIVENIWSMFRLHPQ